MDAFVVDFEVRTSQQIFSGRCPADERKDIFHRAGDDTRFVGVACEGVRLPRGGLPVREDDGVVALHGGLDVRAADGGVYGLVGCAGEDGVEVEFVGGGG